MHLAAHETETLAELGQKITTIAQSLYDGLVLEAPEVTLQACDDIFSNAPNSRLYFVQSGQVYCRFAGKPTLMFSRGDILGLTRMLSLPGGTYYCDESVVLQPCDRDTLINYVCSEQSLQKLWSYFLVAQLSWLQQALAQEIRKEFQPSAGFLRYSAGETIIRQGDEADLVYSLIDGSADAVCDGVTVGEVRSDEIFGALAVFTGQKRIASIVARTDCTVLTVKKDEFIELVEHQPHICIGLIEEMAEKIKLLNSQLASCTA
ncbi:Crp/Fnr family transcriptional regulator [Gilvimarinus sp. DA14]|uniref:Crp/Fnr family transcriptional regulator n=1 Tax=Gilvimarinus sp. DA14 TaxID=2956798 RepID=UPI0020B833C2|nr:cyclic nucleotide-binding domain-containing protein [Gilvimarinus sp. DA14]UTF59964.1 cyclic nucleotide-binding domain-containing protein [Gilvimarinus sp. DA14]